MMDRMSNTKLPRAAVLASAFIMLTAISAQAYPLDMFIDGPEVATVINLLNPNPTLVKVDHVDILGGQRDLLLEASGTAGSVTYAGTIGQGAFVFNSSSPGVTATLQYDGIDADVAGPPASLVNAEGLGGFDLTADDTDRFNLDFLSIDGGDYQYTDIEVEVHNGTDVASFVGTIPDSGVPIRYVVLFSSFTGDTSALLSATSLEIRFNPNGHPHVDFTMTGSVGAPEPATMGLLALGGLAILKRKRKS